VSDTAPLVRKIKEKTKNFLRAAGAVFQPHLRGEKPRLGWV